MLLKLMPGRSHRRQQPADKVRRFHGAVFLRQMGAAAAPHAGYPCVWLRHAVQVAGGRQVQECLS